MTTSRRSRPSRGRRSGSRRKPFWIDTLVSDGTASGTQDTQDLMATPSQFDKHGLTLVRTILDISVFPEVLFTVVGTQSASFGLALIEQDAFAGLALPDLNFADDTPGRGWIYRTRVTVADHTTAGAISPTHHRIFADVRGKRIIGDMELIAIFNNDPTLGTAFTVRFNGAIRQVFLES